MNNFELDTVLPTVEVGGVDTTATLHIRLRDGRLSITGSIREAGRGITSAGQCLDTVMELYPDNTLVKEIHDMWAAWHLNDMRAGCEHQRAEEWNLVPVDPEKGLTAYINTPSYKGWNQKVWQPYDQGGFLSKPCKTCGYKYGSGWIFEKLPQDVVDTLDRWRYDNKTFTVREIKE